MKRYREFQQELIEAALQKAKFKSPMDRLKEPYARPKERFYGGFDPAPDDLIHHPRRGSNLTTEKTLKMIPDQKKFVAWARRVLKDWSAGKMSLAEVEGIFTDLTWLRNIDHSNPLIQIMSKALKKRLGSIHSVAFLDADPSSGSSVKELVPLNGKTIRNITKYFEALVDFSEEDWPEIVEKFKNGKARGFVDPREPKSLAQQDREANYIFGPRDQHDWIGPKPLDPADGYPDEPSESW